MIFKDAPDEMLLVEFNDVSDKSRVLTGCPWSFKRHLLLVSDLNGEVQPFKLDLACVPFWVQIHDLPLINMNREVGEKVGKEIGEFILVDMDEQGVGWGKSFRVRVKIDVKEPLLRGKKVKLGGQSMWVYFQYEKLSLFCYGCGRIWHGGGGCSVNSKSMGHRNSGVAQFCSWLRAMEGLSPSFKEGSRTHGPQSSGPALGLQGGPSVGESSGEPIEVNGGGQWSHQEGFRTRVSREDDSYWDDTGNSQPRSMTLLNARSIWVEQLKENEPIEVNMVQAGGNQLEKVGLRAGSVTNGVSSSNGAHGGVNVSSKMEIVRKDGAHFNLIISLEPKSPLLAHQKEVIPITPSNCLLTILRENQLGGSGGDKGIKSKQARGASKLKSLGRKTSKANGKKIVGFKHTQAVKVSPFSKKLCVRNEALLGLDDELLAAAASQPHRLQ